MKYRKKYEMSFPYGDNKPHHTWSIIGRHGAKHLHISGYEMDNHIHYSGGLETHWRNPPDYMEDKAPSQDKCWLLGQPCWHDGTSLYVSERVIPAIERGLMADSGLSKQEHEWVFRFLEQEMETTFSEATNGN